MGAMNARADGTADVHVEDGARDAGVYRALLESTKAIPWKIDWPTLRFAYIGPQIADLLGWTPESWKTVDDWAARMHPEDRDFVVQFCVSQSQAGVDHEADYRALTRDGGYVWIRDVVHVQRNAAGEVESLVGFMFDISERKRDEEEIKRLHREMEALLLVDGLTGIANRRLFDQRLELEWGDSRRSGKPLALMMVDVDRFKQYNDTFGHQAGDDCLRSIGAVLRATARRPRDVAARLGGDEFVLLLPETDAAEARVLAQQVIDSVAALALPHGADGCGACVGVTVGVATQVADGADMQSLVRAADRMLYAAKRDGRGQVGIGVA